jgi:3-hydroxyacyl-CoA dehydrogenase
MLTGSQPAAQAGHGFRRAAVVGAGLMGRGIAAVLAAGGLDVTLYDVRLARMGPLENADYVGLDLTIAIHDAVLPSLSTDGAPGPLLRELVQRGRLGAKTGQGFPALGPGHAGHRAPRTGRSCAGPGTQPGGPLLRPAEPLSRQP